MSAIVSRRGFLLACLLLGAIALVGRMVQLTIFEKNFLQHQGDARAIRTIAQPAHRGMITDRNGYPLAVSTPVFAIWVNPQAFEDTPENLQKLGKLLGDKPSVLKARLAHNQDKEFVYLKRQVPPAISKQIADLHIPGVSQKTEYKRFYPSGPVTAHVLGFTNIDDQGQEGMELSLNDWLTGTTGKERVVKDRIGHVVEVLDVVQKAEPGKDVALSLSHRIQYIAYTQLLEAVNKTKAKSGSVVVLDVRTGEVLAMANVPSYNANKAHVFKDGRYRNRAVTDMFEPGSAIKPFSVANALENGHYTPNSIIDTSPGRLILDGNIVKDHHDNGKISLTKILQISSNVGMSKVTLSLPEDSLWNLLHTMGFGERTTSGFPGEANGVLRPREDWAPFSLATLSFGYGMTVTTLQLAQGYAEFASGGIRYPVSLIKLDSPPVGERVLSEQVANEIIEMLESVVKPGGTGTRAQVTGYRVFGKTGTARLVGANGYDKYHHNATFVGGAPVSHPRLVVAVMLHDPQEGYYGGQVAAPVFAKVMGEALRVLDVPPDITEGVKS